MASVRVTANEEGEYWFDVEIAGERKRALMDTGFTGDAEISVNRENWNKIKDTLKEKGSGGVAIDYQGNPTTVEYGKGKAKFIGFETEAEKLIVYVGSEDDLLGSNFFHNFPNLEMNWSFRTQTITLTELEGELDKQGEEKPGDKGEEELHKKKMGKKQAFEQEFEENKTFYQKAKNWIRWKYRGRYVIIGAGQLLDVQDTYDLAIKRANDFKRKFPHVMVFKAEEEPFFGTIKFGIRSTYAHPET